AVMLLVASLCFTWPFFDQSMFFFFQAEDGIRDRNVTGVQTCALPPPRCRTATDGPARRGSVPAGRSRRGDRLGECSPGNPLQVDRPVVDLAAPVAAHRRAAAPAVRAPLDNVIGYPLDGAGRPRGD